MSRKASHIFHEVNRQIAKNAFTNHDAPENKKDDHINKFQLIYKKYPKNKLKQDKQKQSFDS